MHARSIIVLLLAVCAVTISLQNLQASVVRIFFWDLSLPLIVLIFIILLTGFTTGYLYGEIRRNKSSHRDEDSCRGDT